MDESAKVVLDYFYRKIRTRIPQLVKEEIKAIEYSAEQLIGGLGLDAELRYFEDLHSRKMETFRLPSGQYSLPTKFSKKELQRKEFDAPSIIENRIEVYESPYEGRKVDFINLVAKRYRHLEVLEYLKSRIIKIKSTANNFNNGDKSKTSLVWNSTKKKELKRLYECIIEHKIIEEIDFDIFKCHFQGAVHPIRINFLQPKALVFLLFDKLSRYIQSDFYSGKDSTPSPAVIQRHFVFKGKEVADLYSVKSKGYDPMRNRHCIYNINQTVNALTK